jgi:hypothetical protein
VSRWFGFEQRWRDELCRAALPCVDGRGWAQVDTDAVWRRFDRIAPPAMQRAWRATVWLTTLRPLVRRGWPRRLGRLSQTEQAERLSAMAGHRSYAVAQLGMLLRLVICVAYLSDVDVRARTTDWLSP